MDPADDAPVRGLLRTAGLVVLLEGVLLALVGAGYLVSGLIGEPEDRLATVLEGAAAALVGLGLVPIGRGLGRGRSWALSPTVVVQVLAGVVASGLLQGGVLVVGVPLLLVAGFVLYALAVPESRDVFRGAG